MITDQDSLESR